jgi:DNA invertase Pin-like site-specific DNA recombinase
VTTAAAYLRVSHDDPRNEQVKLPVQREECARFAAELGIEIGYTIEDDGISGELDERHRPGLKNLVRLAEAGAISSVIVLNMSRLVRGENLTGHVLTLLDRANVRVLTVMDTHASPLEMGIRTVIDAEHVRRTRENVIRAFARKTRDHEYTGGRVVFGLRWVDASTREIHLEEADRLLRAIGLIEGGASVRSAARAIGIRHCHLGTILRNPSIAGAYTYARTAVDRTKGRWGRKQGTAPRIDWGVGPEIITPDRWRRLQPLLGWQVPRAPAVSAPLTGLLVCGVCGRRLRRYTTNYRPSPPDHYYHCPEGRLEHVSFNSRGWPAGIAAAVADALTRPGVAQEIAAAVNAAWSLERESGRREAELARLERAEKALVAALASGEIPDPSAIARELAACQGRQQSLRAALRDDRTELRRVTPESIRERLRARAAALREGLSDARVLRQAIHEVRVLSRSEAEIACAWGEILPVVVRGVTDSSVPTIWVTYRHSA